MPWITVPMLCLHLWINLSVVSDQKGDWSFAYENGKQVLAVGCTSWVVYDIVPYCSKRWFGLCLEPVEMNKCFLKRLSFSGHEIDNECVKEWCCMWLLIYDFVMQKTRMKLLARLCKFVFLSLELGLWFRRNLDYQEVGEFTWLLSYLENILPHSCRY